MLNVVQLPIVVLPLTTLERLPQRGRHPPPPARHMAPRGGLPRLGGLVGLLDRELAASASTGTSLLFDAVVGKNSFLNASDPWKPPWTHKRNGLGIEPECYRGQKQHRHIFFCAPLRTH
eukprot:519725-Pyramimonas_sp.AAC.1